MNPEIEILLKSLRDEGYIDNVRDLVKIVRDMDRRLLALETKPRPVEATNGPHIGGHGF